MAVDPVTPRPGLVFEVATADSPVVPIPAGPAGGFITNPVAAEDQGLAEAAVLYVSPLDSADDAANDATFALSPGQTWTVIPGQTTPTSVNSKSSGHKFSVVYWT